MCPAKMAKLESAMRVALEFNEALNRNDLTGMSTLISEACVIESPTPPPDGKAHIGKEAFTGYWLDLFQQNPGYHREMEEVFSAGFRCILRWKTSQQDDSGARSEIKGVDIFRVEDGLITEILTYTRR